MRPFTCSFIFARGGSKGIPQKNIRSLGGKPLIAYAIQSGLDSNLIDRVFVSTDDLEIAEIAKNYGAEVPFMRPHELAEDATPEWLAWRHAIKTIKPHLNNEMEIFVSLPPTAPLRSVRDVDACITAYLENDADIIITVKKSGRHPSFNMVTLDDKGFAHIAMPLNQNIVRRQDASDIYDMTTVAYVSCPDYILDSDSLFSGKVLAVIIAEERAVDIDTPLDFEFAEFLKRKQE